MTWRKARAGAFAACEAVVCNGSQAANGADAAPMPSGASFHVDDASLPDPARTPGDGFGNAKAETLCNDVSKGSVRVPSRALCDGAFADYGIPPAYRFQYACRFLVPVEIGGASTPRNVWPQPVAEAAAKDALDREIRTQVCGQRVAPRAAQSEIAADWVKAYRHYLLPGDPAPVYARTQPSNAPTRVDAGPSLTPRAEFQGDLDEPSPGADRRRALGAVAGTSTGTADAGTARPAGSQRRDAASGQRVNISGVQRANDAAPARRQTPAAMSHPRAASAGAVRRR